MSTPLYERILDIEAQNPAFFVGNPKRIFDYYSTDVDRATEKKFPVFADNMDIPNHIKHDIQEAFEKFLD